MSEKRILDKFAHKKSVLASYRSLLKLLNRFQRVDLSGLNLTVKNDRIGRELNLLKRDIHTRKGYLVHELRYTIEIEYRSQVHNQNSLFKKLAICDELHKNLSSIVQGRKESIADLLQQIVDYRANNLKIMKWKTQFMENKNRFEKATFKDRPSIVNKRAESRQLQYMNKRDTTNMTINDKNKLIKQARKHSIENSNSVMRRYLKELQMNHKIPNPFLLPYTPDVHLNEKEQIAKSSLHLPGSTKSRVMAQAYDTDYINSIVKPSIEFDINKFHYLENLNQIVNSKGPYKVQINMTNAGPTPIPYIRLPYRTDEPLKKIALDIKKMMRLTRLKSVWNFTPGSHEITEPQFKDGSFAVRGSKGFYSEERIFPCAHYMSLAQDEALWESILSTYQTPSGVRDMNASLKSNLASWTQDIDYCTRALDNELNSYYEKYKLLRSSTSPLINSQEELQTKMNEHYNRQIERLGVISKKMNEGRIFKHAEVVNEDHVSKTFAEYIPKRLPDEWIKERGFPTIERLGMGKTIGDYLEEIGYHHLKLGQNYNKRIRI